jgi:hypothetical protein
MNTMCVGIPNIFGRNTEYKAIKIPQGSFCFSSQPKRGPKAILVVLIVVVTFLFRLKLVI